MERNDPLQTASHTGRGLGARVAWWLRSDVRVARLAIGVVALHVADDNFVQPNPGMSAGDHLVSRLVPLERRVVGFFDRFLLRDAA